MSQEEASPAPMFAISHYAERYKDNHIIKGSWKYHQTVRYKRVPWTGNLDSFDGMVHKDLNEGFTKSSCQTMGNVLALDKTVDAVVKSKTETEDEVTEPRIIRHFYEPCCLTPAEYGESLRECLLPFWDEVVLYTHEGPGSVAFIFTSASNPPPEQNPEVDPPYPLGVSVSDDRIVLHKHGLSKEWHGQLQGDVFYSANASDSYLLLNARLHGAESIQPRLASRSSLGIGEDEVAHSCRRPWPQNCHIQCGNSGIVFTSTGSYQTAFFEAFPKDPDTFIRGEGENTDAAEEAAWLKLEKYRACPGHKYERRGYTNGAGFCKHCGLFASDVFEPTEICQFCGAKTYYGSDKHNRWYCKECKDKVAKEDRRYNLDEGDMDVVTPSSIAEVLTHLIAGSGPG